MNRKGFSFVVGWPWGAVMLPIISEILLMAIVETARRNK